MSHLWPSLHELYSIESILLMLTGLRLVVLIGAKREEPQEFQGALELALKRLAAHFTPRNSYLDIGALQDLTEDEDAIVLQRLTHQGLMQVN